MPIFLLRRQRPWSHSMGKISKTKMWHFLKLRWIEAFICRICFYNGQRRINKQLYAYRPSIVDIHKNAHIKGGGGFYISIFLGIFSFSKLIRVLVLEYSELKRMHYFLLQAILKYIPVVLFSCKKMLNAESEADTSI